MTPFDFSSAAVEISTDGKVVIALFNGEPWPVVIVRGSADAALTLIELIAAALQRD
jgi:hypothetical protein